MTPTESSLSRRGWNGGDLLCVCPVKISVNDFENSVNLETGELIGDYIKQKFIEVPCGKCIDCLEEKSREWSFRIQNEASLYKQNCFITLTYRDSPLVLIKKDLQDFMKRLRKRLEPLKIRYFACGEYGSMKNTFRPHFHVIIFGWSPSDMRLLKKDKKGFNIYVSDLLSDVWKFGFHSVTDVNDKVSKYCAKYMQKLIDLPPGYPPPFTVMSRRPGIGYGYIKSSMIESDRIYSEGYYIKLPRYYLNVLSKRNDLTELKAKRLKRAEIFSSEDPEKKLRKYVIKKANLNERMYKNYGLSYRKKST